MTVDKDGLNIRSLNVSMKAYGAEIKHGKQNKMLIKKSQVSIYMVRTLIYTLDHTSCSKICTTTNINVCAHTL